MRFFALFDLNKAPGGLLKKVKDAVFARGGFKERCRWIYKK
jgi:hypothetical protein